MTDRETSKNLSHILILLTDFFKYLLEGTRVNRHRIFTSVIEVCQRRSLKF